MILHVNHIPQKQNALAGNVACALVGVAADGQVQGPVLENLNVHLEWLQYKTNFREAIALLRAVRGKEVLPWIELGVDLRQVQPECLKEEVVAVLKDAENLDGSARRIYLESFVPGRLGMIWQFNRLFWQHLPLWESAS